MGNFTFEEMNLMCIYNTGSRTGLINSLREMRGFVSTTIILLLLSLKFILFPLHYPNVLLW